MYTNSAKISDNQVIDFKRYFIDETKESGAVFKIENIQGISLALCSGHPVLCMIEIWLLVSFVLQ